MMTMIQIITLVNHTINQASITSTNNNNYNQNNSNNAGSWANLGETTFYTYRVRKKLKQQK